MATASMRGLSVFIADIRNCQNKDEEAARVEKELYNIRAKTKSDKGLTAYNQKKYVWKLLYIYMLGYEVDFGHMLAVNLISSAKYPEKQVGYLVTSVLLNETHEFIRLLVNSLRTDVTSRNETFQCLALTAVANIGGKELAEALTGDVQRLLMSSSSRPIVRKKAAICLLRLFRSNPEVLVAESWADKMLQLLDERDIGVLTGVVTLLVSLVAANPVGYENCIPKVVKVLDRLISNQDVPPEYTYYGLPSPWLQVKIMRVLQYYPPPEDRAVQRTLLSVRRDHKALYANTLLRVLQRVLMGTEVVKIVNKNNAAHAVLFEALGLVMHLDGEHELMSQCVALLGKFIAVREPNIRYLGLENMSRMSMVPEMMESIRRHQAQIISSLNDTDISIRRRALELLYSMCDRENARGIVDELLGHLGDADFAIREEISLKIAILAEKFAPNLRWYVDTMVGLISFAGEFVSDPIWHRVVQIVTNNEDLQEYAAGRVWEHFKRGSKHEAMTNLSGYILGEFGHHLNVPPLEIFQRLHDKFVRSSNETKTLLLSAYIKLLLHDKARDPRLHEAATAVFRRHEAYANAEMQQRATEYLSLAQRPELRAVMDEMPKFPERASKLERKMVGASESGADLGVAERVAADEAAMAAGGYGPGSYGGPNSYGSSGGGAVMSFAAISGGAEPPAMAAGGGGPAGVAGVADLLSTVDLLGDVPEQPPPPPPPIAPGASPMELLGGLEAPAPPPQAADPFGGAMGDLLGGPVMVAVPEATVAVQPLGSVEGWFNKLCAQESGVLYEDPHLQLGVKAEYSGAFGRIQVFFGNKSEHNMEGVRLHVPPTPTLRVNAGAVPSVVGARQQEHVMVEVACVGASLDPPKAQVSYTLGGQAVQVALDLPVVASKFLTPLNLPAEDFFNRWKALPGPPQKAQGMAESSVALAVEQVEGIIRALRLGVLPGLDPKPTNIVACSSFHADGSEVLPVLVRLEVDIRSYTRFRVTVGSSHPTLSSAIKELVVRQLRAFGADSL